MQKNTSPCCDIHITFLLQWNHFMVLEIHLNDIDLLLNERWGGGGLCDCKVGPDRWFVFITLAVLSLVWRETSQCSSVWGFRYVCNYIIYKHCCTVDGLLWLTPTLWTERLVLCVFVFHWLLGVLLVAKDQEVGTIPDLRFVSPPPPPRPPPSPCTPGFVVGCPQRRGDCLGWMVRRK